MQLDRRILIGVGAVAVVGAVVIVGAVVVLSDRCVIPSQCDVPAATDLEPVGVCGEACDPELGVDCGPGFECISGTCLNSALCMGCGQVCESDADCPSGLPCIAECGPSGTGCTGRSVCYSVSACYFIDDAMCGQACENREDCGGAGFRCVDGVCANRYPEVCNNCGVSCDSNADCPDGMTCSAMEPGSGQMLCWNPGLCRAPVPLNPEDLEQPFDEGVPPIGLVPTVTATVNALLDPGGNEPAEGGDSVSVVPVCGDGVCEADEACGADCECIDDGLCTLGEMDRGSCRDCSAVPGDLCGVPCSGACEGGLECTDAGVCWNNGICGGPGGGGDGGGDGGGGQDCSACTCQYFGGGYFCTDVCPGAACTP